MAKPAPGYGIHRIITEERLATWWFYAGGMTTIAHPTAHAHWLDWAGPCLAGLLVMLGAAAYPRAGQAAMVLSRNDAALASGWALQGRSRHGQHLIVRMPTDRTALGALMRGIVLVAVPDSLCSPPKPLGKN